MRPVTNSQGRVPNHRSSSQPTPNPATTAPNSEKAAAYARPDLRLTSCSSLSCDTVGIQGDLVVYIAQQERTIDRSKVGDAIERDVLVKHPLTVWLSCILFQTNFVLS